MVADDTPVEHDPYPPDHHNFPDPDRFATYLSHRIQKFKTHSALHLCKSALSGQSRHGRGGRERELKCHAYVFEFDYEAGSWVLLAHLPKGTILEQNEWYNTKYASTRQRGPSDASVKAAIKSIVGP